MRNLLGVCALICSALMGSEVLALENISFGGRGTFSYSSANLTGTSGTAPMLLQYGVGLMGYYSLSDSIMVGLTSNFSFANQYSDPNASAGNFRGTRWDWVSPSIAWKHEKIMISLDPEFLGTYSQSTQTGIGSTVTYNSPLGGRLMGVYALDSLLPGLGAGLQFEYVRYGGYTDSSQGSFSTTLGVWQAGLTATYMF